MTKAARLPDSGHVAIVAEYLHRCIDENEQAGLVSMFWHIDGRYKTIPLTVEINAALEQCPNVYVSRFGGRITFCSQGSERTVTDDDVDQAYKAYNAEFQVALNKLKSQSRT